jgi:hypothetical protein
MSAQPFPYRPDPRAKNERNRALIADYLGGMKRIDLAAKYGLAFGSLNKLLHRHGVRLPPSERSRRYKCNLVFGPGHGGRPRVWPDCPPHLAADYVLFRRKGLRAAEARALLDPGFAA